MHWRYCSPALNHYLLSITWYIIPWVYVSSYLPQLHSTAKDNSWRTSQEWLYQIDCNDWSMTLNKLNLMCSVSIRCETNCDVTQSPLNDRESLLVPHSVTTSIVNSEGLCSFPTFILHGSFSLAATSHLLTLTPLSSPPRETQYQTPLVHYLLTPKVQPWYSSKSGQPYWMTSPGAISNLWLNKVLANERKCYICKVFSHWLMREDVTYAMSFLIG